MIPQQAFRVGVFAFGFLVAAGAAGQIPQAQPQLERLPVDLAVTNGLIRWWPNLFDVRDEISGQEGVVMGVLPPVKAGAEDATEFGRETGWVQLQPAITNEVFTLAVWVLWRPNRYYTVLLGQESDRGEWLFQNENPGDEFVIGGDQFEPKDLEEWVRLTPGVWHHLAIARRLNGTSIIWVDGARGLEGRMPHAWPANARWLTAGCPIRGGDTELLGGLRDLCAFDRVLSDQETHSLYAAGLPTRPARCTAARLSATRRLIGDEVSTNVVMVPARNWMHRRFTTEDELPGNEVKAVLQTHDGYLWVGTEAGLARFDGRQFRTFTAENTPALKAIGQTVWSLSEEADGTIWAGIFGGLLRIRGLEFTSFTNGLPQRFVLQAEPAGDGSVWIAGFNAFVPRGPCWLRRYYPDSQTSSEGVVVPGHIRRLLLETNGVWIAAEQPQKIHFWDGHSPATTVVATVDDLQPTVRFGSRKVLPPDTEIHRWEHEGTSNWWARVELGHGGPTFTWVWGAHNHEPRLARWHGPAASDPWFGIFGSLARLHEGVLERIELAEGEPGPEITCLCANREGGVWFGTGEDGLHFVQERLIRVHTTRDGLSGNDVRSVCTTPDGGLWAGTDRGLGQWRNGHWILKGKGNVRGIASDGQGQPWFGLSEYSQTALRTGDTWMPAITGLEWQDPNSLLVSGDGTLWVTCERGLTWLKPAELVQNNQNHWVPNPTSPGPVFGRYTVGKELPRIRPLGLVEDRDGSIWMGSLADGLFHVKGGHVDAFSTKDGLAGNYAVPVFLDNSNAVWIVGEGGLSRYHLGRIQKVTPADGLPKDLLLDLREDELGYFWLSGKRGIHRVSRQEVEDFFAGRANRIRSLTLGVRDGLLTPECSSMHYPSMAKTPDGHIWVATRNGLASFDPRQVHLDTQPLPSVIEHVMANRREVPGVSDGTLAQALKLPPGSGQRLEFHYAATSLLGADRVKFRTRLDGYETEWSPDTDLRLAFYTNLRPGQYRFHVKAANAHGIWNDQDTALGFVILPYFWQTIPFYFGCGLGAVMLAGAVHWRRLTAQRRLQELRHQQALTSEKARIAADMHDELGAALTQIAILGEVAKGQSGNESQTRSTLERISQAARDVTAGMSDLVWATNPRNDTLDNLVAYLRQHVASQFENTPIRLRFELPGDIPKERVSATFRRNLLLVIKESLNNIIKHSGASEVCVQLETRGPDLLLRVRDNGRGFEAAQREGGGNGLGNMRKRVTDLGGEFTLRSAHHQGTEIEVSVPIDPRNEPRFGNGS